MTIHDINNNNIEVERSDPGRIIKIKYNLVDGVYQDVLELRDTEALKLVKEVTRLSKKAYNPEHATLVLMVQNIGDDYPILRVEITEEGIFISTDWINTAGLSYHDLKTITLMIDVLKSKGEKRYVQVQRN